MIYVAIAATEVAFWLFLVAGLAVRYLLHRRRLGAWLLVGSPAADLALLALTALDLHGGGTASQAHALAAVYLGVSVGFGHRMVRWADTYAAYRWGGGPRPTKVARHGRARVRHEWADFGRAAATWLVACALLLLLTVLDQDGGSSELLLGYAGLLSVILTVWFVTGPVPATFTWLGKRDVSPEARGLEQS